MKIILFYHSLISDWNHGNAHFLRGICTELQRMGHDVKVYEPENGWSLQSLIKNHGEQAIANFKTSFPDLQPHFYDSSNFHPEELLHDADLVIVHEWNDPEIVKAIGEFRVEKGFTLFFHDTHHRGVSAKEEMSRYDLSKYDGVLAFGAALARIYEKEEWASNVWVWHEAADLNTYYPLERNEMLGDLVWIGNWGDEERTAELHEFIIEPVKELGLKAKFYGVRYPQHALDSLQEAGIEYGGWLPTNKVAETFAKYRVTVHVPRRFYALNLPGIPTIRPFEAMACKIPLLTAPWEDCESLFTMGKDYLMAVNGEEMKDLLYKIKYQPAFASEMADHAYDTIASRHSCKHRAQDLINIFKKIREMKSIDMTLSQPESEILK